MIEAIFKYSFLQNAFLASIFAGVICGIIGVIIVEKKLLMMSGGIAHTAYGGVGLGYLLGFEPMLGAGIFSVTAAVTIGAIRRKNTRNSDVIIAVLWSLGMALGIIFTEMMPGYPPDMNSYLFGNILSVTKADLDTIIVLTIIVSAVIWIFYNDFKAFLFDEKFAAISGLNTALLEYLLLIMTALSVVALIRIAGIILVIVLLSAPAACASFICKTLRGRMLTAIILSTLFSFAGITVSFYSGLPAGAVTVVISAAIYLLLACFKAVFKKKYGKNHKRLYH